MGLFGGPQKPEPPVPPEPLVAVASTEDLDRAIGLIGEAQGLIAAETATVRQQVAKLEADLAAKLKPQQDEISRLAGLIKTYAVGHRGPLFGKAKSKASSQGEIGFRTLADRLVIADPAAVLARVKALGLSAFFQMTEALDLSAMKKDKAKARAIDGVTFAAQGEKFWIKPVATGTEVSA